MLKRRGNSFRMSKAGLRAEIATDFFIALQGKKIRRYLMFYNLLDSGVGSTAYKDKPKALARATAEYGQKVVITMQGKGAAESIATLAETTFMAKRYTWSLKMSS